MFEPENDLERALVTAAADANRREPFLRMLMDARVFVAFSADRDLERRSDGTATVPAGAVLTPRLITRKGITCLPFFSARSRVRAMFADAAVILPDTTRAMFARNAGGTFVLNPGCDYGRDFPAAEAARLLAGDFGASHSTVAVTDPDEVLLDPPQPYPAELAEVLKAVFADHAAVAAAYLAQADFQNGDRHPVIALQLVDTPWREMMNAMQGDLRRALASQGLVDFVPYSGGPFDEYFSRIEPFYIRRAPERGWRRWLSRR